MVRKKYITYHIKKLRLGFKVVKCILSTEKDKAHMRISVNRVNVDALALWGRIPPPRVEAHTPLG